MTTRSESPTFSRASARRTRTAPKRSSRPPIARSSPTGRDRAALPARPPESVDRRNVRDHRGATARAGTTNAAGAKPRQCEARPTRARQWRAARRRARRGRGAVPRRRGSMPRRPRSERATRAKREVHATVDRVVSGEERCGDDRSRDHEPSDETEHAAVERVRSTRRRRPPGRRSTRRAPAAAAAASAIRGRAPAARATPCTRPYTISRRTDAPEPFRSCERVPACRGSSVEPVLLVAGAQEVRQRSADPRRLPRVVEEGDADASSDPDDARDCAPAVQDRDGDGEACEREKSGGLREHGRRRRVPRRRARASGSERCQSTAAVAADPAATGMSVIPAAIRPAKTAEPRSTPTAMRARDGGGCVPAREPAREQPDGDDRARPQTRSSTGGRPSRRRRDSATRGPGARRRRVCSARTRSRCPRDPRPSGDRPRPRSERQGVPVAVRKDDRDEDRRNEEDRR